MSYTKHSDSNGWTNASCSNSSWCEINGLDFGTHYHVSVAALTVKGLGPSAHAEADTDKAGKILNDNKHDFSFDWETIDNF